MLSWIGNSNPFFIQAHFLRRLIRVWCTSLLTISSQNRHLKFLSDTTHNLKVSTHVNIICGWMTFYSYNTFFSIFLLPTQRRFFATLENWQKIDLKMLFGLTYHSTMHYPQNMHKFFFDWSIEIFQSLLDYIKFSTETHWRLITAVCKLCPKYTKGIIIRLHPHRVTNWHYVTVE